MIKGNHNIDEIRKKVTDFQLASYYLGIKTIPCLVNSPLRKDRKPSFGFYSNGDKVYFRDFSTGEKGSIYDLLSLMWGMSFNETLNKIAEDNFNQVTGTILSKTNYSINRKPTCKDIKVRIREWKKYDAEYWASYGVPVKWLKYAGVYPISHKIMIMEDGNVYTFPAEKLAYAFVERKDGKVTVKIYQPLSRDPRYKWCNKHDKSVISLWTKVPKTGDKIIICSSLKDALCLWSNVGVPCIAVQGEGYNISDSAIKSLKERYKEICILFDNDNAGIRDGIALSEKTGFRNIVIPPFEGGKDVSDFYKVKGKEEFINTFKNLIQ